MQHAAGAARNAGLTRRAPCCSGCAPAIISWPLTKPVCVELASLVGVVGGVPLPLLAASLASLSDTTLPASAAFSLVDRRPVICTDNSHAQAATEQQLTSPPLYVSYWSLKAQSHAADLSPSPNKVG